ncbi:hypothetical protein [Hoeflea poritis]|uniref:Transposase n=1 Tax=Hoeflea poritis TaxID=2993659 RepID=A0ABT4VMT0_9HYPH|nr:hypothetical protein [Hoeflea poritis]MDA4846013.1 hypothetical protein [Hoeflea poritis]
MTKHNFPNTADPLDMMVKARLIRWRCMTRAAGAVSRAARSYIAPDRSSPNPLQLRGLDVG